jgi:3D (Asp-Asp-Asp) domain-containing protein
MPAARLAAVLTAVLAATSLPAAGGAGSAPALRERAQQLRQRDSQLAARTHEALLQLYSLETRLGRARATLADLRARRAALAAEQRLAQRQVAITQRAVGAAQDELSSLARALYEQGEPDPLAVLLGASSLDDAISGLDGIQRAADQSRHVIAQARATRARLQELTSRLSRQQADLRRLTARTEATAATLASARAERTGYVAGLARERALTKRQVASLEVQAQAAQARSAELTASAPAPSFADQVTPLTSVLVAGSGSVLTVSATGYALPGTTATGIPVGWGVVAVDPSVIPLGTRLFIPGYGEGVAADTGSAVRGATIDLWFPKLEQALAWGRKTVTVTIH